MHVLPHAHPSHHRPAPTTYQHPSPGLGDPTIKDTSIWNITYSNDIKVDKDRQSTAGETDGSQTNRRRTTDDDAAKNWWNEEQRPSHHHHQQPAESLSIILQSQSNHDSMLTILTCLQLLSTQYPFSTAFSASKLLSRSSLTSIYAENNQIFQDDDCQDLCDAFEVASEIKPETIVRRAKPRPPRRTSTYSPKPSKCNSCHGEGAKTCRFCGGTEFLSGNTNVVFYEGIGKDCPVCKEGMEVCRACSGTGYVYTWRMMNLHSGYRPWFIWWMWFWMYDTIYWSLGEILP